MKKLFYASALTLSILLSACSSDDNDDDGRTCEIAGVSISIVDNGDGTATVSADGESETVDLEGVDFDTFAENVCNLDFDFGL